MNSFVQKHAEAITGALSGFDRLIFRGTLLRTIHAYAMLAFLRVNKIDLSAFGTFVETTSKKVRYASLGHALKANRPVIYLESARTRKDLLAREIAARDHIENGPICVLTGVEPCRTFGITRNPKTQKPRLSSKFRKCLHLYHYSMHPQMGLMHVRLQTWFPFSMQVYINGREWLSRTLDREKIPYLKEGNCFLRIEDAQRAQELFDTQLRTDWPSLLNGLVNEFNPAFSEIFKDFPTEYHWSAFQSEWATDVMFKDAASLDRIYPRLVHHAVTTFDSPSIMRFMGRHVPKTGKVIGNFKGENVTWTSRFSDCVRIRHAVNGNSIKLYNKEGSVLRVETTISETKEFRVYRSKEGCPEDQKSWLPMRRGVADLKRRAEVSQASNQRYLESLAAVDLETPLGQLLEKPCQPVVWKNKRVRALQPTGQDADLLAAIGKGDFAINGFRNRDIRNILMPKAKATEVKRCAGQITRKLRMLRAHGLIQKVHKTQRYQITTTGRALITALSAAKHANVRKLIELAA